MGTLHTDCPYPPTYANDYHEPDTCYQASKDFVARTLFPIAIAAIVIGSIESFAMTITFALIWQSKDVSSDTAFDY